ncbi:uncharacterized protein LOC132274193 [Cornus florida]|uniref:uncharacterized protein LOC132274193 n=1 Tax=Cornus florida TaxID=4283 RepID=UPI0028A0B599|nr:uncharacterized protein LOC132274193 [Cornus florida]
MGAVDHKVWGASSDGLFSVKSAYRVALSILSRQRCEAEAKGNSFDGARCSMWVRGVTEVCSCPFCESFVESVDHLLCSCSFASMVWIHSPLRVDFRGTVSSFEMSELWSKFEFPKDCLNLAAFTCWAIWKSRNDLVFNHKKWTPLEVANKALQDFYEYQEASRQSRLLSFSGPPVLSPPVLSPPPRWCAPEEGSFKLNFDAAFDSSRKLCGGGMILHNHFGQPVTVSSLFFSNVGSPSFAEGLILWECLSLL